MSLLRRSATIAALALALSGPALSADAATTTWKTLVPFDGAKVQACKVPTTVGGPWNIKLRVNATSATSKVEAHASVVKGSQGVGKGWNSGWVQKKKISAVGGVRMPHGSAYSLVVSADNGQAGNGGQFKALHIPHC